MTLSHSRNFEVARDVSVVHGPFVGTAPLREMVTPLTPW